MFRYIKRLIGDKKKYKSQVARIAALPQDYRFVLKKIQGYMWGFAAGDGYDMLEIQESLIEMFEAGAAEGKPVLELTGEDVAGFCDELLRSAKTYTGSWRQKLNRDMNRKLGKRE